MSDKLTVLVTGATGKQGGYLARELLARGHAIRALTRKPESAAAAISEASGRHIEYTPLPIEAVRQWNDDLAGMFEWFDHVGYDADVVGLR